MSTEVIGGADGPTAIFVTSSVNWGLIIGIAAVVAIGIIVFCVRRKKKK